MQAKKAQHALVRALTVDTKTSNKNGCRPRYAGSAYTHGLPIAVLAGAAWGGRTDAEVIRDAYPPWSACRYRDVQFLAAACGCHQS